MERPIFTARTYGFPLSRTVIGDFHQCRNLRHSAPPSTPSWRGWEVALLLPNLLPIARQDFCKEQGRKDERRKNHHPLQQGLKGSQFGANCGFNEHPGHQRAFAGMTNGGRCLLPETQQPSRDRRYRPWLHSR